ncbi:hypothetical protein Daqu01_03263 [Deinococcus aquaticus]
MPPFTVLYASLRRPDPPPGPAIASAGGNTPVHPDPVTTNAAPAWINGLSPGQLALTRVIQQNGLEGRPVEPRGFAWYLVGEVLVTVPQQRTLSAAFDLAVRELPCTYLQQPVT